MYMTNHQCPMRTSGFVSSTVVVIILVLGAIEIAPPSHSQPQSQQSCVEFQNNPVLNDSGGYTFTTSTGKWFAYNHTYSEPAVLERNGVLRMWYAGTVGGAQGALGIFTAVSRDGANWSVNQTPVLTSAPNGSVWGPSVLYNGTGYMMYYTENNGTTVQSRSIGAAFSSDGIHWTRYSDNPVLVSGPGVYDSNYIKNPSVVYKDGAYEMWYAGSSWPNATSGGLVLSTAIDYATSGDGLHWSKYPGNPVFVGAPDQIIDNATFVGHPNVLDVNGTLLMLYGDGYSIRYAISQNGINWTPMSGNLVSSNHSFWESDYVSEPAALLNGSELNLWYYGASPIANQSSPYIAGIGLAYCGLVIVEANSTTTATTTVTSSYVQTMSTTWTVTSLTTSILGATTLPLFQATSAVGAGLVVILLYLLMRRHQG